jgi:hypothetical protein
VPELNLQKYFLFGKINFGKRGDKKPPHLKVLFLLKPTDNRNNRKYHDKNKNDHIPHVAKLFLSLIFSKSIHGSQIFIRRVMQIKHAIFPPFLGYQLPSKINFSKKRF